MPHMKPSMFIMVIVITLSTMMMFMLSMYFTPKIHTKEKIKYNKKYLNKW